MKDATGKDPEYRSRPIELELFHNQSGSPQAGLTNQNQWCVNPWQIFNLKIRAHLPDVLYSFYYWHIKPNRERRTSPMPSKPDGTWLTVADCATSLAVSTRTIRRAIKRGELTAHKGLRSYRISSRDWRLYLAEYWPESGHRYQ